jgi:hypothetical protein
VGQLRAQQQAVLQAGCRAAAQAVRWAQGAQQGSLEGSLEALQALPVQGAQMRGAQAQLQGGALRLLLLLLLLLLEQQRGQGALSSAQGSRESRAADSLQHSSPGCPLLLQLLGQQGGKEGT